MRNDGERTDIVVEITNLVIMGRKIDGRDGVALEECQLDGDRLTMKEVVEGLSQIPGCFFGGYDTQVVYDREEIARFYLDIPVSDDAEGDFAAPMSLSRGNFTLSTVYGNEYEIVLRRNV